MKKNLISALSLFLTLVMLLGAFSACSKPTEDQTSGTTGTDATENTESETQEATTGSSATESATESETESASETESDTETDTGVVLEGTYGPQIQHSNELANGVQAYFTDADRTHYAYQNSEMTMTYARANTDKLLVESIKNTEGKTYVQNTMDVFIRMTDGKTYYASDSSDHAEVNIYRFGYYYYQGLFEGQNFLPASFSHGKEELINPKRYDEKSCNQIKAKPVSDGVYFEITETIDPIIAYEGLNFNTETYNGVYITLKTEDVKEAVLFTALNNKGYVSNQSTGISINNDGEYHTYFVLLSSTPNYSGKLTGLRIDPAGKVGAGITIKEIKMVGIDFENLPHSVSISRQFHVYTDKMHQLIQFSTYQDTENVAEVGMITEIDANTVDKILVKDKNGEHTSLDKVDWASVQCVGFDIKDTGIFGYILPVDEVAGSIKVTLEGDKYIITQSRVPEENMLFASAKGTRNGNDFYIGQRIYTDENHDFEEFLYENFCEQEPLIAKNIKVSAVNSTQGSFAGYDAKRGVYILNLEYAEHDFFASYYRANRNFRVNFQISAGEIPRDIYIMTFTNGSTLECAALLGDNLLHLPVPIEVIKNFSEPAGDRNLYNLDDPTFSEAIFPLKLEADQKYEYTILNLYQNWGNYPLKQLSSIPFFSPYYHLSTGTTETNCITPWFETRPATKVALSTLPDFRGWSSSFWKNQPQHTSSGTHHWLAYTDAEGNYSAVECIKNTITSYGPTYAEVIMDNISDDGKIAVSYTHMEMPQVDENRTYYTMEYTVLEDVTFKDFKNNFQFYSVTDNNGTGLYREIGYLDENNEYAHADANFEDDKPRYYPLGDKAPYFSYYNMGGEYNKDTNPHGYTSNYSNVAFLIYNYDFNISTLKETPRFVLVEQNHWATLTLDLDEVTFKAGDTITINAIALPWGSEELDGTYETTKDQSARNVREDTMLNPLKVSSTTDEIIESHYLPKVKSKDGKSAEFTLSGGENNVTVRIYGFEKLTAPKVEELVDGKWVEYELNSANHPDEYGYFHYYDGYGVYYDGDGTYSYSFVTTMHDGAPRTFRIKADEDFDRWPVDVNPQGNPNYLDVYADPEEIKDAVDNALADFFKGSEISEDGSYVTIEAVPNCKYGEGYIMAYKADATDIALSGKYFVVKYRVPADNPEKLSAFEIWLSTENGGATPGDSFHLTPVQDGEWHVMVVDVESLGKQTFKPKDDNYYVKYIRFDMFDKMYPEGTKIDIAYIGMDDDLMEICKLNAEEFKTISYMEGSKISEINTITGQVPVDIILDPNAKVTLSKLPYGAALDSINADASLGGITTGSKENGPKTVTGATVSKKLNVTLRGWCVVDGGVSKYVWSADGGLTWNDCEGNNSLAAAYTAVMNAAKGHAGTNFSDYATDADLEASASKNKAAFQGDGITVNLAAYAGKTVDVLVAAVPAKETDKLILVYRLKGVECIVENTQIFDPEAKVTLSTLPFGAALDFVNDTLILKAVGSKNGEPLNLPGMTVNAAGRLVIEGWCVVDGGISKYVWSADGGKTWNDCGGLGNLSATSEAIVNTAIGRSAEFSDKENAKKNAAFQEGSGGLTIDLNVYKGEIVNVIFAAVPEKEPDAIVPVFLFSSVSCKAATKLDAEATMAESSLVYTANLDSVNGITHNNETGYETKGKDITKEFALNAEGKLRIGGWCVVNGGVEKYVWTPDNGKTWYDCEGTPQDAGTDVMNASHNRVNGIEDDTLSKVNGSFQGEKIFINLSEYADSSDIPDIWLCAVPKNNTSSVCLLYKFTNIVATASEAE